MAMEFPNTVLVSADSRRSFRSAILPSAARRIGASLCSTWPYRYADKWIFENKLDQNPSVLEDSFIASQDSKFTYWYIRPPQLEPAIKPLFAVPNFPGVQNEISEHRCE